MVGFETFLLGLMIISTLTSLVTEAIKKIMTDSNKKYSANAVAGIVSAVLSTAVSVGYMVLTNVAFSAQAIVYIVAMVFMSWLCAMIGYDKVVGVIGQFKNNKQ